jgi:serine/threonine protein kinase
VITQTKYGFPADIWSFGCTVLEMATGKIPWAEYDFDNPIAAILKIGLESEIPYIPNHLSEDLKDFLKMCLQRDPAARPNVRALKKHSFL